MSAHAGGANGVERERYVGRYPGAGQVVEDDTAVPVHGYGYWRPDSVGCESQRSTVGRLDDL